MRDESGNRHKKKDKAQRKKDMFGKFTSKTIRQAEDKQKQSSAQHPVTK